MDSLSLPLSSQCHFGISVENVKQPFIKPAELFFLAKILLQIHVPWVSISARGPRPAVGAGRGSGAELDARTMSRGPVLEASGLESQPNLGLGWTPVLSTRSPASTIAGRDLRARGGQRIAGPILAFVTAACGARIAPATLLAVPAERAARL